MCMGECVCVRGLVGVLLSKQAEQTQKKVETVFVSKALRLPLFLNEIWRLYGTACNAHHLQQPSHVVVCEAGSRLIKQTYFALIYRSTILSLSLCMK